MYDIITIGDIKLDAFIMLPEAAVFCKLQMPECQLCIDYGKKNTVHDTKLQIAGSAPNVATGLAKMKKNCAVFSVMGDDIIHKLAIDYLEKTKIDSKYVKAQKGHPSSFAAVLNFKGESTQLVSHNGNEYRIPKNFAKTTWVHVSELGEGYEKMYKDVITLTKKGTKISFNPGMVQIEEDKPELKSLISFSDILFVNKLEAQIILKKQKEDNILALVGGLKNMGPKYVVVTDGKNGAFAYDGVQLDYAPMFKGNRIEATGAGDAFATGFLGAIMYGERHPEALMWGSVNAASVIQHVGGVDGLLTHTEIKKRLKAQPSYKTKEL